MPNLKLRMDAAAEKRLQQSIAQQAGRRIRHIVESLHQEILDNTAYNTGRTLGSWFGSSGQPVLIDIADRFGGSGAFAWDTSRPHTNDLPVGAEGGDRRFYEQISLRTTQSIQFERNPYQIFYISNGARLDSGNDFAPGIDSDLPQGTGSRAAAQEYGIIAHFDLFASTTDNKVFSFEPRSFAGVRTAVNTIKLRFGKL